MKRHSSMRLRRHLAVTAAFFSLLLPSSVSWSAAVNLATVPLANSTTTKVLPNLMYIQDNSGSMAWDYVPDWVVDANYCKGGGAGTSFRCCRTSGGTNLSSSSDTSVCMANVGTPTYRGMPPFLAYDFNRIYYNPAITYKLPVDAGGNDKTVSYGADYGAVPLDGYGKQTTATINLKTSYPDVEWCTDGTYTDCLRVDNYLLPGTVDGKSYTTMRETTSSSGSSAMFVQGTVTTPTTASRALGPYYYVIVPGEYCKSADLKECQSASDATYKFPAPVRWCTSSALTICQAVQDAAHNFPKYPTILSATGTAVGKITLTGTIPTANVTNMGTNCSNVSASTKVLVSSMTLNGTSVFSSSFYFCTAFGGGTSRRSQFAAFIADRITNGFSATATGSVITITAPTGASYNNATLASTLSAGSLGITTAFAGGLDSAVVTPGSFKRVDIVSGQTYGNIAGAVDRGNRTDCVSRPICTYDEELKNFANWMAWYRTRMQMMKTTVSQSFKPIGSNYRVGFITINSPSSNYLSISKFNSSQKTSWYGKLFNAVPSGGTPLRSTLAKVGRIFAGQEKVNSTDEDPIEYSCQQNFSLLTTDGYWNSDSNANTNNTSVQGLYPFGSSSLSQVGNLDATAGDRPMYEGPTASFNSLADVAKYYYDTDLRDSTRAGLGSTTADNCLVSGKDDDDSSVSYSRNVCSNNVFGSTGDTNSQQHMTTFTLGLGVDGTLQYQNDYLTATTGDFACLKTGGVDTNCLSVVNWPVPVADTSTAVDDLWHAAVNGRGKYFSAKDPAQLTQGLGDALASITSKVGAGAAAATSTLNPVSGDNYAYVASYTSIKWTGNVERRSINTLTGVVAEEALWCLEDIVDIKDCAPPLSTEKDTTGSSSITYCVSPKPAAPDPLPFGWTACPGGVEGDGVCKVPMQAKCTGTMHGRVAPSENRIIKVKGASGSLVDFDATFASMSPGHFDSSKLAGLSQWTALSGTQQSAATGATLVNYLRGQKSYEDTTSNTTENRLYRYREAVIGDLVNSQPAFIAKPTFSYLDEGYSQFVTNQASRAGTVYVGSNDGMLHAINAVDGQERWAYIPTPVLPNLWKLADKAYASGHAYYVDGSPIISDICTANCTNASTAVWKTILVGGLNGGGRGFYALDITSPSSPTLLWEFTNANDQDLGYSYGNPVITKKADGTWVVLLTSGYNNAGASPSDGDGKGYLYVLNAASGTVISKIPTDVGSTGTPSGLSRISAWADNAEKNNTAGNVYGGDLQGNVWRFDINAGTAFKFAVLKDSAGVVQPITSKPELGSYSSRRLIFVATGKYLETSDLSNTQRQTIYAIRDDGGTDTLDNPRAATGSDVFVEQTLTTAVTTSGTKRTASNNSVTNGSIDWSLKRGWFVDLDTAKVNEGSERVSVNMQLVSGTLLVASIVPASSECSPGGYGWFSYFDYRSGSFVEGGTTVSDMVSAPIVGFNVMYVGGKPVVGIVTASNPTPKKLADPRFPFSPSGFKGTRVIWRELLQ